MTLKERDVIDQLRSSIHEYHNEVRTHIARCEACNQQVHQLVVDVYGNPEDRLGSPGMLTQVADLKKSRRILLGVAAGAWTLATTLLGTVVARMF